MTGWYQKKDRILVPAKVVFIGVTEVDLAPPKKIDIDDIIMKLRIQNAYKSKIEKKSINEDFYFFT